MYDMGGLKPWHILTFYSNYSSSLSKYHERSVHVVILQVNRKLIRYPIF